MVHVYNCLTRREPQLGLPVPMLEELVQPAFASAVQTLLDTKHFIKHHTEGPLDAGMPLMESLCCLPDKATYVAIAVSALHTGGVASELSSLHCCLCRLSDYPAE